MNTTRRQVLLGMGATTLAMGWPVAGRAEDPATTLDSVEHLHCVYIDRASGKVVMSKTFADVNPEALSGDTAATPYKPPTKNVYIGRANTIVKQDITRFAIVDFPKRNEGLGFFSSLKDSYTPEEYTHHFMLSLADRELARTDLEGWVNATITAAQKASAMDTLRQIHKGTNGRYITEDPDKMAEAVRFYNARELLKPSLYIGKPPSKGDLAMIGTNGIQVASNEPIQLALATTGQITKGITVDGTASNAVSLSAKGATEGTSVTGASVGSTASVGASGGGSSDAGDGGSGTGGGSSSGGSSGGASSGGGSGAGGGGKS